MDQTTTVEGDNLPFLKTTDIQVDCWLIINGYIVDFTGFGYGHPGGPSWLNEYKHRDASEKFNYFHKSDYAKQKMKGMAIGRVQLEEDKAIL
ncbi:hypothetical protein ABK040_012918 [Willaertia magna]